MAEGAMVLLMQGRRLLEICSSLQERWEGGVGPPLRSQAKT